MHSTCLHARQHDWCGTLQLAISSHVIELLTADIVKCGVKAKLLAVFDRCSMEWHCHALHCHGVFQRAQQAHACTHGARNKCFSAHAPHARLTSVAAAAQSSSNGSASRDSPPSFLAAVPAAGDADEEFDWRSEVHSLAAALRWACHHMLDGAKTWSPSGRTVLVTALAAYRMCTSVSVCVGTAVLAVV